MNLAASALTIALSTVLTTGVPASQAQKPAPAPISAPVQTVREQVEAYFADIPIMVRIAGCESHFRQFETDGSVFRGEENHLDVGVMQINEHYHLDTAKGMGLDLHTIDGNMQYARYLYQHEGTAPWISSAYCWDPDGTHLTHGDQWQGTLASAQR